jgi:hypothetical protein
MILESLLSNSKLKSVTEIMLASLMWFTRHPHTYLMIVINVWLEGYLRLFRLKLMFQVCIAGSCLPSLGHLLQIYY